MILLTPELIAISEFTALGAGANVLETRELDFNLARRSAIVIAEIVSTILLTPVSTTGSVQDTAELDLDPDNTDIWHSAGIFDGYEIDQSRLLRHSVIAQIDVTATSSFALLHGSPIKRHNWRNIPLEQRPISITNLRHHHELGCGARTDVVDVRLMIYYQIAELTLQEIGYINASRR